jgi:hypothetical protein
MYNNRDDRRYRRYRTLSGLATGIFIISLAVAFYFSEQFGWRLFVPILFAGGAFVALFVAASSRNPKVLYGGLQSFTWLLSLGILFSPWVSFWPWILIPVGVSIMLGALYTPIVTGLYRSGFVANPPPQERSQPYPSNQQGYQRPPTPPMPGTYQEGGQPYAYPTQPEQQNDQPQAQPPQQEETLLHQQ